MILQRTVPPWALWGGAAVAAALLLYFWRRGVFGVASDLTSGAVNAATGAAAGAVLGIGDAVGIPRTNAAMCQFAKDQGSWSDVATYCPAPDALRWAFSDTSTTPRAGDLTK